jgi:LmbE family N-acetylglucosaminyl deacetylase
MSEITKVFISPHNDDETLFGAFTIMAHRPLVIVVYDSYVQVARGDVNCDAATRQEETKKAIGELLGYSGCTEEESGPVFCGLRDDTVYKPKEITDAILHALPVSGWETITDIWAPAEEKDGHDQHNLVAQACNGLANHRYLTYTRTGGKSRGQQHPLYAGPLRRAQYVPRTSEMIARKHRAMACYTSQIANASTQSWFTGDIEEYYER